MVTPTQLPTRKEQRRQAVKLHLTEKLLIGVAHVALRSAQLDTIIETTLYDIVRVYPKTLSKRALKFSTPDKIDIIKDYLIKDLPNSKWAITEFISELNAARNERHDIVHKAWRSTGSDEEKLLFDVREWVEKKVPRRVTYGTLMTLATNTVDLIWELNDWKMCVNAVHRVQFGAWSDRRTPLGQLPTPPRVSQKDEDEKTEQLLGRQRGTSPS